LSVITYEEEEEQKLLRLLGSSQNVIALTGAGISTDSGIPDYRGVNGSYKKGHKPMMHQEFIKSQSNRRRYWARSLEGYSTIGKSKPNAGHDALKILEQNGPVQHLITQNVDGLHTVAGSRSVTELHGSVRRVICFNCQQTQSREEYQEQLLEANHEWIEYQHQLLSGRGQAGGIRADGDAELGDLDFERFEVPTLTSCQCGQCMAKPDVVFFGDSVNKDLVDAMKAKVAAADLLLVCGTSLAVWSAFRFVRLAAETDTQVAIINMGETRADTLPSSVVKTKVNASTSVVLPKLATALCGEK
jgi:NAD-dependent SIR2 family protein deacetylase